MKTLLSILSGERGFLKWTDYRKCDVQSSSSKMMHMCISMNSACFLSFVKSGIHFTNLQTWRSLFNYSLPTLGFTHEHSISLQWSKTMTLINCCIHVVPNTSAGGEGTTPTRYLIRFQEGLMYIDISCLNKSCFGGFNQISEDKSQINMWSVQVFTREKRRALLTEHGLLYGTDWHLSAPNNFLVCWSLMYLFEVSISPHWLTWPLVSPCLRIPGICEFLPEESSSLCCKVACIKYCILLSKADVWVDADRRFSEYNNL